MPLPPIRRAPFGREPGGLNTSPTVNLNAGREATIASRPQPTVVQSFLPSDRIPGNFGEVRSVRLADLPLQPTNPRELAQAIQSRQAFLNQPGGYAELPNVLTPDRRAFVENYIKAQTGLDPKTYVYDNTQGVSWKKPEAPTPGRGLTAEGTYENIQPRVKSPMNTDAVGYPGIRMGFANESMAPKLPLTPSDIAETRSGTAPTNYNFGTAQKRSAAQEKTGKLTSAWGDYAKSDLNPARVQPPSMQQGSLLYKGEAVPSLNGYRQNELESLGSVLNPVNAGSTNLGSGEVGEVMMRGGYPVSAGSEMVNEAYQVSSTPQYWTDAPTQQIESFRQTGQMMPVGTGDALYRTGYSVPTNETMNLADIMTGVRGASDYSKMPQTSAPTYVTRSGQANPESLSSTPMRQAAYGVPGTPGYEVMPEFVAQALNSATPALSQLQRVRSRDVTEQAFFDDVANALRPEVRSTAAAYRDPSPSQAYVQPVTQIPLEQINGGFDLAAVGSSRDYPDKHYNMGEKIRYVPVEMPSTVLKDKGTSAFELSLGQSVDAQRAGLAVSMNRRIDQGDVDRRGLDEYVQTKSIGETNRYGEQIYEYSQPAVDARDQLEKLEGALRRSQIGYNADANRIARSTPTPNTVRTSSAMAPDFNPARFEVGAAVVGQGLMGTPAGEGIRQRLVREGYLNPDERSTAMMQDAYQQRLLDGGRSERFDGLPPTPRPGLQLDDLLQRQGVRNEFANRVRMGNDAIAQAYSADPSPAMEAVTLTRTEADGSNPRTRTADMALGGILQTNRRMQQKGFGQVETWLPQTTDSVGQQISAVSVGPEQIESSYVRPDQVEELYTEPSRIVQTGDLDALGRPITRQMGEGQMQLLDTKGNTKLVYPLKAEEQSRLQGEVDAGVRKVMPVATTNPQVSMPRELMAVNTDTGTREGLGMQQVGPLRLGGYAVDQGIAAPSVAEQVVSVVRPSYESDDSEYLASAGRRLRGERPIATAPEIQVDAETAQLIGQQAARRRAYTNSVGQAIPVNLAPRFNRSMDEFSFKGDGTQAYALGARPHVVGADLLGQAIQTASPSRLSAVVSDGRVVPTSPLSQDDLMARRDAMLRKQFGDNYSKYLT